MATSRKKPIKNEPILHREFMMRDDFHEQVAAMAPPRLVPLNAVELSDSINHTLAAKPKPSDGIWVFAYGSLLWDCPVKTDSLIPATAVGWHRTWSLEDTVIRGTIERPSLTMGLESGDQCQGVALHLNESTLALELKILWRREMLFGAYSPQWIEVKDMLGRPLDPCIAFTQNTASPRYLGSLPYENVVRRLASASGPFGSSIEYLSLVQTSLSKVGLIDTKVDQLLEDASVLVLDVKK